MACRENQHATSCLWGKNAIGTTKSKKQLGHRPPSATGTVRPTTRDYEWENNGTDRFARPYLNGGLKSVEYAQAWSDVPQVIVPYGADRNMSGIAVVGIDETTQMQSTFGKRLRLDPNTTYNVHDKNGENAATITTDAHGALSNPNVNTGIEITKFYDDIYPQCHFKITKVEVKNKRQSGETVPEYTCEGIAVDARYTKEYLAQKGMFPLRIEEATTLSVRFESGFLNGREFEIANKTHKDQGSTGYSLKFTIVADGSIEDGTLIPSGNFKPIVGDQFALFNMKMPAEFVSLAKQDLAQRAYEELLDLQNTRPEVKCTSEPFTFMQHTVSFGAIMQVSSELFGDEPFISRVIAYSYKLTLPSSVQFSLASAVMQGTLSEMNNAISDVTHTAGGLEQRAINLSRRGWRDANEVADMLDSITSEMMLVGNERYQFGITTSIECVDSGNKFASLRVGYGSLQHTQEPYINYANRGLWEISGATLTKDVNGANLDPDTPYYLFAQVADDTNPARLILTTDAHKSESEDDVPYLLLGILSSEFEGRRVFSRTNGYTAIEGGTITTEQIQDASRNLIIDFQSNPPRIIARNGAEIIGSVKFSASDTKTAEEQLADLGLIASNAQSAADAAKEDAAAAQAALDNLEIGGRNIVRGSGAMSIGSGKWSSGTWRKSWSSGTVETITLDDAPISGITAGIRLSGVVGIAQDYYKFNAGDTISMSVWVKPSIPNVSVILQAVFDNTLSSNDGTNTKTFILDKVGWQLLSYCAGTKTHATQHSDGDSLGYIYLRTEDATLDVCCMKVEKGNKATDWTPAPEDVEASIAENKTYTEGLVTALGDTLQSQIDGVVDSYFMEGVPTTSNAPANEWTTDELKQRHEGDTYTNIQQYTKLEKDVWEQGSFNESKTGVDWSSAKFSNQNNIRLTEIIENRKGNVIHLSDYSTYKLCVIYFNANKKTVSFNFWKTADFVTADYPYIAISITRIDGAQTSIADVVASGVVINPDAGKSWRWCKGTGDSPATGWHWHEIADSDAVRALQSAAKAQDTADGKRRVFVVQPTPPYEVGDLWAQGSGDGKDILKCKTAKTAGQTFAQDDWEAASSALTKAGQAATEAATAKANAQTALTTLTNIASDNVFTKQEKCSVRTEWASIQAEFTKNTNNAKVCWGESGYTSNTEYAAYKTAYNSLNSYLANTAKLSANEDTQITPADFNKAFSDYYGANVTLLNAIAKRVSEIEVAAMSMGTRNLFAKKYMLDWNAKSVGTTTVNFDDYGEYYQIKENQVYTYVGGGTSYNDILQGNVSFETGKQYCLKVKWRVPSEVQYNGLYLGFKYSDGTRSSWIICAKDQTTPAEATLVSASGKTVAGIVCTYSMQANTRIYEIQLTEGNKAPSGWAEAEADKETGGENLYTGDNPLTIAANATNNFNSVTLVKNLQNNARYVFSCGKSVVKAGSATKYTVLLYDSNTNSAVQNRKLAVGTTRVEQAFTIPSTGTWSMLIYSGVNGSTAGISMEYTDIMVQKGNRATAYQTAVGFLGKAIKDMDTTVTGGLLMTGVLMLKDTDNKTVTAGMSGLTEKDGEKDNVLLWGGGTYFDAFNASRDANYLKKAGGTPITTLLKKDGTGKIGIFKISDTLAVIDVPNQGKVVIDASTANGGISCIRSEQEKPVVLITPKELADLSSLKDETVNKSNSISTPYDTSKVYQGDSGGRDTLRIETETQEFSITVGANTSLVVSGQLFFDVVSKDSNVTLWTEQDADEKGFPNNTGIRIRIYKSDGTLIKDGIVNGAARQTVQCTIEDAGTYRVTYQSRIYGDVTTPTMQDVAKVKINSKTYLSYQYTYKVSQKQTIVAYKGIFSYQGENAYLYYKDGVGFDCKMGNIRLQLTKDRIKMSGLSKSATGLSSGDIWRNGNQLMIVP